ncbi:GNAT family N-acetyltransferase [Candidatus Woesearchaeota archaeon]|nr:GNAT family N-acetyltransferase [Candidatus Woesearchaeota archaeon]
MIIKKAKINDIPIIVRLWYEFMNEHNKIIISENSELKDFEIKEERMQDNYEEFLRTHIESFDGTVFIALENEEIIGYILIFIKDEIPIYKNKKIGYISDLYVKKELRKKAVGSKLKDKSFGWFKEKGIKFVAVPMYPDNKHAHSIYKKWGFFDYKLEMRRKI